MERALLQGEREAERALLQKEQKAVDQLQEKLVTLETGIQKERDKVTNTWPGSVLGTSILGEKEKCFLWGLSPLSSLSFLQIGWSLCPSGAGPVDGPAWKPLRTGLVSGVSVLRVGDWVPAILGSSWPF